MKNSRKISKKLKKIFNLYNLGVFICVIFIVASVYIIFRPKKANNENSVEVIQTYVKQSEEISEEDAKKVALKQFKKLGEKVKLKDLEYQKIRRGQVEYYYITSPENSLEIAVKGGKIERINGVIVE